MSISELRAKIEAERDAAQQELDDKFENLLKAVSAFDTGAAKSTRTRKRNAATQQTAANDAGDTTPPPATTTTDDEEYEKTEFFHDVNTHINEHLLSAGADGMSKKALQEATGYSESVLDVSLKYLVNNGSVVKSGLKRGTKYHRANLSESANG